MNETRWAVVHTDNRAGQRPRGWPRAMLRVVATEDDARRMLGRIHTAGQTGLEVVEVKLRDGDWPMWIQVGTEPDAEAPADVVTVEDLRARLDAAGWLRFGHGGHHAMLWTCINGDMTVTGLRSGHVTLTLHGADLCGSLHGSPAAVWAELRRMGAV